jgi:hypothetical protein
MANIVTGKLASVTPISAGFYHLAVSVENALVHIMVSSVEILKSIPVVQDAAISIPVGAEIVDLDGSRYYTA